MKKNLIDEQAYLDKTISRFNESLLEYESLLKGYYKEYDDNPLMYSSLIENAISKVNTITKSKAKPYFARIDFEDDNQEYECYISKVGVFDLENNPVTIDWRAPIASLYYDGNLGSAKYEAPDGIIEGKLTLKRQYEINNGVLEKFVDVDTVTSDEILKPYLSASNDNRLKNIVSTIQSEQNAIIRTPISENMIIQGVAGSGKTTVALHRIAYLEYNYRDKYKSTDYLVIGPNKYFIKYISGVLPDLDVYDTHQVTFNDLFESIIKNKFNIHDDNLQKALKGQDLSKEKYKLSMKFKKDIDDYLKEYTDNFIKEDFYVGGIKIIDKQIINKYFNNLKEYEIFSDKIEKLINNLCTYVKQNYNSIQFSLLTNAEHNNYKSLQKSLKSYFKKELRDYFNLKNINIINLYKDIIQSNILEYEDYPGIMYVYYKIFGIHKYENIKHTVIDEAQDYGLFNFYILKKILPNSTFSIYGDLAQSLYSFHSIDSWEELSEVFDEMPIRYLNKSYRTTKEILNYANKINKHLGLNEATPVIRHGKNVVDKKYNEQDFLNTLKMYHQKGYSIAIIIKDDSEYKTVEELIKNLDYNINIVTSYNVKGLEYDATVIWNADEEIYNINNNLDMKLLYVSLTRALHEMTVYYQNNLTTVLK